MIKLTSQPTAYRLVGLGETYGRTMYTNTYNEDAAKSTKQEAGIITWYYNCTLQILMYLRMVTTAQMIQLTSQPTAYWLVGAGEACAGNVYTNNNYADAVKSTQQEAGMITW